MNYNLSTDRVPVEQAVCRQRTDEEHRSIQTSLLDRGLVKLIDDNCYDPQCSDSTWDHDCPSPRRG